MSKILAVSAGDAPTAATYHRQRIPLVELATYDDSVSVDFITLPTLPSVAIGNYDTIMLRTAASSDAVRALVKYCHAKGVRVIYDIDDDKSSQRIMDMGSPGREELMRQADVVTVTTPFLQDKAREYNDNAFILRNRVKWALYQHQRTLAPEQITVGFAGTSYHNTSITISKRFSASLRALQAQGEETQTASVLATPRVWFSQADAERKPHILLQGEDQSGMIDFRAWPSILAQLNVQFCFLYDNDVWNSAKSRLKQMEAWAAGSVFVGSTWKYGNWNPYNLNHESTLPDWRGDGRAGVDTFHEARELMRDSMVQAIYDAIFCARENPRNAIKTRAYVHYLHSWEENPPTDYQEVYVG